MYEFRWLERKTGKTLINEWGYYYPETIKILQYRTKQSIMDYSSMNPITGDYNQTKQWSVWTDIPVVEEKYDNA